VWRTALRTPAPIVFSKIDFGGMARWLMRRRSRVARQIGYDGYERSRSHVKECFMEMASGPRNLAAVAWLILAPTALSGEILNIGDAPPPLTVSKWIKGDKVEEFKTGTTYVVEFWATWCGPCRGSIPRLTDLAHEYKDKAVRFIGIDVWEGDAERVEPFVTEMGDKMDYAVARDIVPEGSDQFAGAMAKAWLEAAEERGIPSTFVIHDGKIAWIGHPHRLEEPLKEIVANQWNTAQAAKERLAKKLKQRKTDPIDDKVLPLFYQDHDYKAALEAVNEATKDDPELANEYAWLKFAALYKSGEIDRALDIATKLLDDSFTNANGLNDAAWEVIDPDIKQDPDPRALQFALKAARRAVKLTKEADPNYLDTLAQALFRASDAKEAVAIERKAVKLLEKEVKYGGERKYNDFNDNLARFSKSVAAEPAP
jgi:thiol-disulfide isomerase/thioredoxin